MSALIWFENSFHFSSIDWVIGLFLVIGFFRGFQKGLLLELFGLAGAILGFYAAVYCSAPVANFLAQYTNFTAQTLAITAFILTFLLAFIALKILGKTLTALLNFLALGLLNRLLGALFGLLKTTIILCALLFLSSFWTPTPSILNEENTEASFFLSKLHTLEGKILPVVYQQIEWNTAVP